MDKFIIKCEDDLVLSGYISSMVNKYNKLHNTRTSHTILNDKATYCVQTIASSVDTLRIIGCVGIIKEFPTLSRIMHLCVEPEFRELGIGKKLVTDIISIAETKNVYMRINKNNNPCIHMAKSIGFRMITTQNNTIIVGRRRYDCTTTD